MQSPLAPSLQTRLRVFEDLWMRGYYVAFGSKFAAKLLIYTAAPTQSHAVALVFVRDVDALFPAVALANHCRVASMVHKRVLLATKRDTDFRSSSKSTEYVHTDSSYSENGANDSDSDPVVYIAIDHALLATRHET